MAEWRCRNSSCNSFGIPHPNCLCSAPMAEGGESSFCSDSRSHDPSCEYFADGGGTLPSFDDLKADPEPVAKPAAPLKFDDLVSDFDALKDDREGDEANYDLSPADLQAKMVKQSNPEGAGPHETIGQQAATVAEGAAQGLLGSTIPTVAEIGLSKLGVPGTSAEEQAARQSANPKEFAAAKFGAMAASMATGVGEAGLLAKYIGGSAALKNALSMGIIGADNQVSKAILGQGDPRDMVSPIMAVGADAILGGLGGYAGSALGKGARILADSRYGAEAAEMLAGYGDAAAGSELAKDASKGYEAGHNAFQKHVKSITDNVSGIVGSTVAGRTVGPYGIFPGAKISQKYLGPYIDKAARKAGKYAVPTVLKWLSEGANGSLSDLLDYAGHIDNGESLIGSGVESLFNTATQAAGQEVSKDRIEKLKDYLGAGGNTQHVQQQATEQNKAPQGYAKGGMVEERPKEPKEVSPSLAQSSFATNFPTENILLNTARARVSGYLANLQPQNNQPKLAFDDPPDDRQAKKTYDSALKIAAAPMSVLDHVKQGTIDPEHVKHLNALYPELANHLQQKLTERITKAQVDGEKPSFKVRQGLSMFMGTPLSGEFTPQSIQAAQGVFAQTAQQQATGQPAQKSKKGSSSLTKADSAFLTGTQALEQRKQKS